MKKTVLGVVWLVAVGSGASADEPKTEEVKKKAVDKALETFSGTWEIVAAKPEGIMKEARKLVFRKDLTYAPLDKDGTELWAGTFNLDPTATPKVWDHRSNEVAKKGGDTLGIYELNGDTLKVCSVAGTWKEKQWTGKRRPTAGPRAGRRRGRRGVQGSRGGDVNSLGLLKRRARELSGREEGPFALPTDCR